MADAGSTRQPPHGHWFADLTKLPTDRGEAGLGSDLNELSEHCLEISRAASRQRGGLLGVSLICLAILFYPTVFILPVLLKTGFSEIPVLSAILAVIAASTYLFLWWSIRLELTMPRDEPIRFNRKNGKVYVANFRYTANPLGTWRTEFRVYDWTDLQGELIRYLQFNSRFLVVRYGLEMTLCKPGTFEVRERFWIERNQPFPNLLRSKWAYICAFMNGTPIADLPKTSVRQQTPSWSSSFGIWLPWLADWRTHFGTHPVMTFMSVIMLLFSPFFLVIAVAHYVATRNATTAQWPQAIDEDCGLGERKLMPT
jgi:hypothetical protein